MSIRKILVNAKNNNAFLYYIWSKNQQRKGANHLKNFTDKEAIEKLYQEYSGKLPNLANPSTFSEKLQWLKLNYHNPLMTICADKVGVREYLNQKGYGSLLNNIHAVYEKAADFKVEDLPEKFVLKATHGSGWNLICTNKRKINWWIWKKIMNVWLNNNIFWPGREWPYKNMKPRIVVEEFLKDSSGSLMDFKFFCFNGEVKFIQANKGRDTINHAQNFYDLAWNILPFGKDLKPRPDITIDAPTMLQEMATIAKDLSLDFPFVRVDFYEVESKIIFGEMTFYPKSGLPDFTPPEYDAILGGYLKLPSKEQFS